MLTRTETLETLAGELYSAHKRFREARRYVDAIIAETPDAIPDPDRIHRMANAVREEKDAREALKRAVKRNSEFILNGIVPDDLTAKYQDRAALSA